MEIECDLASIRDEDLLRKMWQQSEDFGRKKEIRSHLYKLRESRLREFYSSGGPGGGGDIMNPATDLCFGKTPLTPSHGDSLEDHSFQSLKSKEVRDSQSPSREIKFRSSGGIAGGVLVPDTTGWNVQTSTEVTPDGRAFRSETLAKTDGVEQIAGGRAEFAGRNEQKSSASHQGDDQNYVKKAAESSKTHLQEKIVIGDENSGRTEMKSSSVTSSSSKVVSSSSTKVLSSGDPGFDLEPMGLPQEQRYQKLANTSALRSEQQKYQTSSNLRDTYEENKKYVDMDKASPEYQQHVQYLMAQPGTVVSNTVEYPKPGVKMITTVKQLPDGTTVRTKRYETEASADAGSLSQTLKQQQRVTTSSNSSQKVTSSEKRIQDTEDVFSRLSRPRDSSVPSGSRSVPETPSPEDIYSRLQKSRGGSVNEKKFSETIDERSTQILRDTNVSRKGAPAPRTAPIARMTDLIDNVEVFSNTTVKKDLSQAIRNEKITSADFIATERDRYVLDRDSSLKRGPDGLPTALAPITPGGYGRQQPDDVVPTNGYTTTGVVQQTSKSSSKFSESRRFSTETVESYQHSESHNENQDFTTHGFPSVRRPVEEPKGRSPSAGRPSQSFSTHGFPSVRADKPTQEYPSDRPRAHGKYPTPDRSQPGSVDRPVDIEETLSSTTQAKYSTNETRRQVTSTTNDFSTHGFPSVREGTPTRDSPKRPTGFEPANAYPRGPSGQDQPQEPGRKPSTDGYTTTHGFPSAKSPTSDAPRRPSSTEPSATSPRRPSAQNQPQPQGRKPSTDGYSSTHGFPAVKSPTPSDYDTPRRTSSTEPTNQGRRPEDFSTHGFPSVKPGRTTPTQASPQYDDTSRTTPVRRQPSVDREDTVSVTSDRTNSVIYEKRIDAAHQAFARSLRCSSPVDTIRRDSFSDRQTPRSSVTIVRHTYIPSNRRDGRSPSHESITNSDSSRISTSTVTKSHRSPTTDNRRPSGPKSPLNKGAPSHVSNETIDLTPTRKTTTRPADKPTPKQPAVKDHPPLAEPILRKETFAATEGFLASEGVAEEPILKRDHYYQLGPSDATLPSSHHRRLLIGTTPTTPRRPTKLTTEEEVHSLLDTATKHTTPKRTPTSPDTKPSSKPETLYSPKPKTRPEGYVPYSRATEITEKHSQTTNKQVSSPHYVPTAPKADRSPSDRPTKNLPSPAPTTITTTTTTSTTSHHSAPKPLADRTKVVPSTSPSTQPSPSTPSKLTDTSPTRLTKTVKVDSATTTRDSTTRESTTTKREPRAEPLSEPEDTDEGYVPDRKGRSRPHSKRPTSDDEGFEPDSPRAGSPTSDFEFHRSRPTEPVDEEDSIFKRTRKVDRRTITNEFLDTERGVQQPRQTGDREPVDGTRRPKYPGEDQPGVKRSQKPDDFTRQSPQSNEPTKPSRRPQEFPEEGSPRPGQLNGEPDEPRARKPRHPDEAVSEPRSPTAKPLNPNDKDDEPFSSQPKQPLKQPVDEKETSSPNSKKPRGGKPPLDRSETFEERCRQILGMETDTKTDKTKKLQQFIDIERDTVYVKEKPDDRSPQRKSPFDTVSVEDLDEDDTGVPNKPSTQRVTTTKTITTTGKYPRGKSPTKQYPDKDDPKPSKGTSPTKPTRETSPVGKTVGKTTRVTEDTTITTEVDERSPLSRPRGRSPTEKDYPRGKSPTDKPRGRSPTDETTVKKTTRVTEDTTFTTEVDKRSPLSRPGGRSPTEKDYPRGKSPTDKPRGRSPTDETTVKKTTRVTEDTTFTTEADEGSSLSRPRGWSPTEKNYPRGKSPTEKPRGRSPTDETTVKKTTRVTEDTTFTTEVDDRSPLSGSRGRSPTEKDYPRGKSPNEKPRGPSPTDETTVKKTTRVTEDTTFTSEVDERSPLSRPRGWSPTEKNYPRGKSPTEKPRGRSPTDEITVKKTTRVTEDSTFTTEVDEGSPLSRPRGRSPTEKDYPRGKSPTEKPRGRSPTDETTVKKTTRVTEDTTFTTEVDDRSPLSGSRGRSPTEKDYPRGKSPNEKPRGRSPTDETTVKKTTLVTEDTTFTTEVDDQSPLSRPHGRSATEKDYPRGKSPTEKPRGRSPTDETTVKKTTRVTEDTTFTTEVDEGSPLSRPRGRSPTEKDYPRGKSSTEKPRGRSPTDETTVKKTTRVTEDTTITSEVDEQSPLWRPRGRSPTEKDYPRGKSPTEKPRGRSPTDETTVKKTTRVTEDTTITSEVDEQSPIWRPRGRSPTEKDYPRGKSPTEKPRGRSPTDETTVKKTTRVTEDTTFTTEVDDRSPLSGPRGRSPTEKDYPRGKSPNEKPRGRSPTDETTVKKTTRVTEDTTFTTEVDEGSPLSRPRGRSPTEKDYSRGKSPTKKPRGRSPTDETTVKKTTRVTEDTTFTSEVDKRSPLLGPRGRSPTEKDYPRGKSPTEKPRGLSPTDETTVKKTRRVTEDTTFTSEVDERSPLSRPRGRSPTEKDYPRGRSPTEKPRGRSPTDETTVKKTTRVTEDTTFTTEVDERSPLSRPRGRSPTEKDYPRGRSPTEKPRGRSPTDETTVKKTTLVTEDTTITSEVDEQSPLSRPRGRSPTEKDYPRGKSPTDKPRGRSPTDETTIKKTTRVTEDTTFTTEVDKRSPLSRPSGWSQTEKDYPRSKSPTEKPRGLSPTEKPRGCSPTDETAVKKTTRVTEDTTFTTEVDDRSPLSGPRGRSPTEKDYPRGKSPTEKLRGLSPTDETTVKKTTQVTEDTTFTSEVDERSPLSRPRGWSPTEKNYPRGKSPTEKPRGRSPTDETTVKKTTRVTEDTTITSEVDEQSPLSGPRGRSPTEKDYPRGKSPTEKPRGRSPTDETTVKKTTRVTEDSTFTSEVDKRSPLLGPRGRSPTEKDYPRGKSPTEKPRGRSPTDETTVKKTTRVTEDTTITSEVDEQSPLSGPRGRSPTEKDYPRGKSPTEKPRGRSPTDETTVKKTTRVTEDSTFTTEVDERSPLSRPRGRSPTEKDYPRGKSPTEKPRGRSPTDETTVKKTTRVTEDTTFTTEDDKRSPLLGPRGRSPTEKDYPRGKSPTEKPRGRSPTDETTVKKTTRVTKDTTFTTEVDDRSPLSGPRGRSPTEKDYPRGKSPTEKPRGRSPTDETTVKKTTRVTEDTTFTTEVDERSPLSRPRGRSPTEKDYPRGKSPTEKPRGRSPTDETTVKKTTRVTEDTTFTTEVDDRSPLSGPRGRSPTEKDYPRGKSPTEKLRGRSPTDETTVKKTTRVTEDTTITSEVDEQSPLSGPRGRSPTEKDYPRGKSPTEKPRGRSPTDETTVKKTTRVTEDTTITSEVDEQSPLWRPRGRSPTEKDYPRGKSPTEKPRGRSPTDETTVKKTTRVTEDTRFITEVDDRSPLLGPRGRSPTEKDYPRGKSPTEKPRGRSPTDETTVKKTTRVTEDTTITSEVDEQSPIWRPRGRSPTEKDYPRGKSPTEKPRGRSPTDETTVKKTTRVTEDTRFITEVDDRSPLLGPRGRSPTEKDYPRGKFPTEKPRGRSPTDETTVKKTTRVTEDTTITSEVDEQSPLSRPRGRSPTEKGYPRGKSPTEKPRGRSPTDETTVKKTTRVTEDTTITSEVDEQSPLWRPRGRSPTEKDYPRGKSPTEKPRGRSPTDETTVKKTTRVTEDTTITSEVDEQSPIWRPRGRSPTEKDYPRGKSPTEKPRGRSPTDKTTVKKTTRVTEDTRFTTEVDERSPSLRPRGRSPTESDHTPQTDRSPEGRQPKQKPFSSEPSDDESLFEGTVVQSTGTTTRERTISEEITDRTSRVRPYKDLPLEKPEPRGQSPTKKSKAPKPTKNTELPQDTSPTQREPQPRKLSPVEKQKGSRPTSETNVQKMVKTITEKTVLNNQLPKDHPRGTSPSDKPIKYQLGGEQLIIERTTKVSKDKKIVDKDQRRSPRPDDVSTDEEEALQKPSKATETWTTVETTDVKNDRTQGKSPGSPRDRSPSEKPKGITPTTDSTVKKVVKSTVIEERISKGPRGPSTAEKPAPRGQPRDKSPTEKASGPKPTSGTSVQRIIKTITERTALNERSPKDRPLKSSPLDKPKRRPTTEEQTTVKKTTKTIKGTTVDTRSPKDRSQPKFPSGKPKGTEPSDDESGEEITVIETWYTTDGLTPEGAPSDVPTDEETLVQRTSRTAKSMTTIEQADVHSRQPQGKSPISPRDRSPTEKPRGTKPVDTKGISVTVLQKTTKTTRDSSPSEKPYPVRPSDEEEYPSDDEHYIRKTTTTIRKEDRPRGRSPSSKKQPRDSSPSPVNETTVRNTTTKTIRQMSDFEKRYPNGRPREPSPSGKSTPRRPSKPTIPSTTTTTTTTRNRSTLEEQDLTKSPRPRPQQSTREKLPTKSSPSYAPHSQPMTEKRVPAEAPRKPKSTFGTSTRTTTQTTVTRVPATRSVPTKESPKKPTTSTRPTARQPERKQPQSISPDSSPSRPGSEATLDSPNRSPHTSPSRHSPSPTRSVKLEDITSSVVTTKKTTVVLDKTNPKVTHITTAKFQVSPPTTPTKVTPAPEMKSSPARKSTPKPMATRVTTNKTTSNVTTTRKDVVHPTDSERDSEVPTDGEDIDSPLVQKSPSKKMPVTQRKESAPVHRVTKVDKDVQKMLRSTSENIIKTTIAKRPVKQDHLEPSPTPKTDRRPNKHLSTKTINLTTFDKVLNSEDMENVVIDIQQAKSSRETSPNKIVPTPVSVDLYTGKPRYPDVVQEPEDEPRKKPVVKNIPIFEEETNEFVGCQITEVSEDYLENTTKARTRKFIEGEAWPQRPNPTIVTSDNVDSECLLSVHDKVSKFISTAEEVSKPKTSAPFRRDLPEEEVPEDDECLLSVDEKVSKFLKTAESVTKDVMTSTPKPIERPRIDDLDEDLRKDECVLSVSEKVNRFTNKAEKLAPSTPQRSPELVARIERQISRQSDAEPEKTYPDSPEDEDSPTAVRKVKQTKSLFEREERKYTDRQIDILSRPSVWDKKPKSDVRLDDILGEGPEDPEPKTDRYAPRGTSPGSEQPDSVLSKPVKPVADTVTRKKEIFENKISTQRTTATPRPGAKSPEWAPRTPTDAPRDRRPSDEPEDSTEEVYGTSKVRRTHETTSLHTSTVRQSPERRSPTRKSSQPEPLRPSTHTSTRTPLKPEDNSPSRRYSDDTSPRHRSRDQPTADLYTETCETSEYTTRSSTQKHPENRPGTTSPSSPRRKHPTDEPEDYTFNSLSEETNQHHTSRTTYRSPKGTPLKTSSLPDDDDQDHSPARSTSTVSSQKRVSTFRTTSNRVTEDSASRRPRRPSGNDLYTPTSTGRPSKPRGTPETIAARRNIFEKSPGDVSPRPGQRRPSYMDHTKSSIEHSRRDSLEVTKTTYSRKSSVDDEPYEPSPRGTVKFVAAPKVRDEPKTKRQLSSSEIPNIEDVFDLELLEEILNIVTSYEQRRRVRAQIRIVKKLLETKSKEEVSKMTKITTIRKTSTTSQRDSPIPRRDTPMRPERYTAPDDIDSESVIESHHIEEHEEIIRERSVSPQTKTSKTVTKVTEVRKIGEPSSLKRSVPKKEEPKDSKPIWATKNILKKPSENEKVARALSAKKTTSTTSTSRTQQTHRQRVATDEDCITSSYGIGPTDEDGRPLFGIRALKKKTTTTSTKTAQPSETTKVTGTVITEKFYSENGAEPVGERKVTVYSTNPEELRELESQYDRRDSGTVKRESLSKDGLTSVTKVQKIGNYKPGDLPALTDDAEFTKTSSKTVRRGSVKEMSEKFIRKESSSSVTEKSNNYPKAGLILRTRTNSGATADTADQYEVRGRSAEYDDESDVEECDVEIRTSRKHSKVVTESEDETEIRRKLNTRSFLNSAGSKVTGVDDVLDRMRNADNVVVDGDTVEDREARSLLNKFLGASVLMAGMESIIPQKELKKAQAASDSLKKQEVKTTRVTKTIKTAGTGGNSSSPVARETCDFEEIWDEEILKDLLEKSTSYEERRSIRARLRQLMAEREACADSVASAKAVLSKDSKSAKTSVTSADKKQVDSQQQADDDSSCSEYEEIIEEYTASEDDDEETQQTTTTTTTTVAVAKKKDEVKEDAKAAKKLTEEIQKTTITKKEDPPKASQTSKTVVVEKTTVVKKDAAPTSAKDTKEDSSSKTNKNSDDTSVVDGSKGLSTTTTEKTETKKEDGAVVTTTTKVTTRTVTGTPKPVSPFAKFQQLDKQSQSPKSPATPTTPGGSSTGSTPIFRFTDPALNARAATVKEQLLQWCQSKTQEYENVQITNFSTSWTDGLAFCALIHHFLPDAFDYSKLTPKQRRYNFDLAFRVADEKAGIAPLLDVEDMVVMKRPDWKCVFTYVQSIYRRFRNCQ